MASTQSFRSGILSWYAANKRDLPWRTTRDPYAILVSEVMLQQTQVSRVLPLYKAFLQAFPTLDDLAAAELGSVLRAWKGLGYNRRAKMLWLAAQACEKNASGRRKLPTDEAALRALPGVGHYTARAVLAFAHNQDTAPVDTNVRRVHTRYFGAEQYSDALPEKTLVSGRARDWNSALMDFGSAVCTRAPKCAECPLRRTCTAFRTGEFSVTVPKQTPFTGSNRFFRGRIIDALRARAYTQAQLARLIATDAADREKLLTALDQLVREDMVVREKGRYSLTGAHGSKQKP